MIAVCIRCGHMKRSPPAKCPACEFRPQANEDKAKSLILSTAYEIDGQYLGKTSEELRAIGRGIAQGRPYRFNDTEVASLIHYAESVSAISGRKLAIDGARWLLPPLLILALVFALLHATK